MKRNLAFLLAFALVTGCGKENPDDEAPVVNPAPTEEPVSTFNDLGQGTHSNYTVNTRAHYVVRDAIAWQFLYKWITGDTEPAPYVAFSDGDVAAAAIYQYSTGGYDIEFTNVNVDLPNPTQANIRENHPAPGSNLTMAFTYPFALASFASDPNQAVRFTRSILVDGNSTEMMLKMLMIGMDRTFEDLAEEEVQVRLDYQLALPEIDPNNLSSLLATTCPEDGTSLAGFDMKLTAPSQQVASTWWIFFCPEHGEYWLLHPDLTFRGPFTPGIHN